MDVSQAIRTAVFQAISTIDYSGFPIPVFDGIVNPNVTIPTINRRAKVYIVINDQQENSAPNQSMCAERLLANITIKTVAKYTTANVTDRTVVEDISAEVMKRIRENRSTFLQSPEVDIHDVSYPISRNIDEFANGQTALSKALIYSITVNQ